MSFETQLERYARLIVKLGVDVQPGQQVLIRAPLFADKLVHLITTAAYAQGARRVHVNWEDEELNRLFLVHSSLEELAEVPQWKVGFYEELAADGAAIITIYSPNPELLKDVDKDRIGIAQKSGGAAFQKFMSYLNSYRIPWCLLSVPNPAWATSVFPNMPVDEAVQKLWASIFYTTRVNQPDPVQAWLDHTETLRTRLELLNELQFRSLHYRSEGTQLEIVLPKGHVWRGGRRQAETGQSFIPNIPAEEVFTAPEKSGVNGTVRSTKPLSYAGRLLEPFTVTFEKGRAVQINTPIEEDAELLRLLLDSDAGAPFLGEVAIVPDDSPISELGIIFKNTLFDENAACHLAFGNAYPRCVEAGETMTPEQLEQHGLNTSIIHMDFMIGSGELDIVGELASGERVNVLKRGKWVLAAN